MISISAQFLVGDAQCGLNIANLGSRRLHKNRFPPSEHSGKSHDPAAYRAGWDVEQWREGQGCV